MTFKVYLPLNALETYATHIRDLSNRVTDDDEQDLDELVGNVEVSPAQQQVVALPLEYYPSPSQFLSPSQQQQQLQLVDIPPEESPPPSQFISPPSQFISPPQAVYIPPEESQPDLRLICDFFGDFEQQAYRRDREEEKKKEHKKYISKVSLPQSLLFGNTKMELDEGDQIKQEQPVVINPIQLDQLTQGAIAEEVRKAVRELTNRVNIQNPTIDLARTVYEIDRLDTKMMVVSRRKWFHSTRK